MLEPTARLLAFIFIIASMLAIGLQVDVKSMLAVLHKKKLLIKTFVANFIIIPLLGLAFVNVISMHSSIEVAFILLSCAPGGLSAIQFISKSKDKLAYAGIIAFLLTTLSVIFSPLIITLFMPKDVVFTIPYFRAFLFLFLFLLVPMLFGMFIYSKYPKIAGKFATPIAILGTISFFAFIFVTLSLRRQAIQTLSVKVLILMLAFILLTMLIGWIMGGPKRGTRQILATASSMRNAALCLLIVTSAFPNKQYEISVIAFSALMVFPNMIFTITLLFLKKKL